MSLQAPADASPLTLRLLEAAVSAAQRGERTRALGETDAALARDPALPASHLVAARVHYSFGQYDRALCDLDRADAAGADRQADELRFHYTGRLGWNHETREVIERRLAQGGDDERLWLSRAVQLYAKTRHHARALEHLERLSALSPQAAARELNGAHLAARLGERERARGHALEAVRLDPERAGTRGLAALVLADGGFADEAAAQAARAAELGGGAPARALLAELCLWSGDRAGAERHLSSCLPEAAGHAYARRLQGALLVQGGAHERALAELDEAVRLDPSAPESYVWRAEALLRLGRFDEATREADRALGHSERFLFATQVIRLLATLRGESELKNSLQFPSFGEIAHGCAEIEPSTREIFARGERVSVIGALETVLERLAGNRGERPTWVAPGDTRFRALRARSGARFDSRWALDLMRIVPFEEVLERLETASAGHPGSPLPVCHRGEAYLWMGRYEEARRDLERATEIRLHTRWAYIGLSALEMLSGRLEQALEVGARGVELMGGAGPAVYVHRGETYRRLGRFSEAFADLEVACQLNPARVSAWLNLSLTCDATGRTDQAAGIYRDLLAKAPGLLSDAAAAVGVEVWDDPELEAGARARIQECALSLLRGNRSSSCQTYLTGRGVVRTAVQRSDSGPGARDPARLGEVLPWLAERTRSSRPTPTRASGSRARSGGEVPDMEWIALRAGMRRAIRLTLTAAELEEARPRYAARGAAVLVATTPEAYEGAPQYITIVSLSDADARLALQAELDNDVPAVGELLGYPACCITAFHERAKLCCGVSNPFNFVKEAWVVRPHGRLNNLLFGVGARYVSFEPCRYDCPAALELSSLLAAEISPTHPGVVAALDAALHRAVAIDAENARAVLLLEGDRSLRIAHADPLSNVMGRPPGAEAERLAKRLSGATIRDDGRVLSDANPEVRVLDFAWRSRAH